MEKDYDGWNIRKQYINAANRKRIIFSEGEIWFCAVGINIGFEQDGSGEKFLRPVVVAKKISKDQFIGIPLTGTVRSGNEYFPLVNERGSRTALLAQIRFFDTKRLIYFSKKMNSESFAALRQKLESLIKNSNPRPIHRWDICEAGEQASPMDLPRSQKDDPQINNTQDGDTVK
jgi:mRNA interferase MazF